MAAILVASKFLWGQIEFRFFFSKNSLPSNNNLEYSMPYCLVISGEKDILFPRHYHWVKRKLLALGFEFGLSRIWISLEFLIAHKPYLSLSLSLSLSFSFSLSLSLFLSIYLSIDFCKPKILINNTDNSYIILTFTVTMVYYNSLFISTLRQAPKYLLRLVGSKGYNSTRNQFFEFMLVISEEVSIVLPLIITFL